MSQFRDLIARMAIDAEFARHARANPDTVARQYGLTGEETQQLRGLADAAAGAGPTSLGARLSKSGGTFGGVVTSLAADLTLDTPIDDDGPAIEVLGDKGSGVEPPAAEGGDGGSGAEDGPAIAGIDFSGLGPALGVETPIDDLPESDSAEHGDDSGSGRTYEVLGEKGSTIPLADADDSPGGDGDDESGPHLVPRLPGDDSQTEEPAFRLRGGDGDGDSGGGGGGSPGFGLFGDHSPFSDPDGDGLPNMFDQQPHNPDTSDEPYADNDGDGQPNMSDPTPDGMLTIRPDIDFNDLLIQPDLPGEINIGDLNLDGPIPGGDASEAPSSDTPSDAGDTPSEASDAPADSSTGTRAATETGNPSIHDDAGEPDAAPDPQPVTDTGSTAPETGEVLAQEGAAPPAAVPLADAATDPADDGLGARDYAIGGAGLAAGAVAGGIAGAVAGKGKADNSTPEMPAQS